MTPEQKVARANDAKRMLEDPLVIEALMSVEDGMIKAWRNSSPTDAEARERAYWAMWGLDAFRSFFATALADGKLAQYDLDKLEKRNKTNG